MLTAVKLAASAIVLLSGSLLQLAALEPTVPAPTEPIQVEALSITNLSSVGEAVLRRPALAGPIVLDRPIR